MIVDLKLWLDGVNIESLEDVEVLVNKIDEEIDSIYPVKYDILYLGD